MIATHQDIFAVEDSGAHTLVENVGALVASRHDDGVRRSPVLITGFERFYQFVAGDNTHFAVLAHRDERKAVFIDGMIGISIVSISPLHRCAVERADLQTQMGGIAEHGRSLGLAHHFRQLGHTHIQAVAL